MVAVLNQILGRLVAALDLFDNLLILATVIGEEGTQPALTFVYSLHMNHSFGPRSA
jgi:hypothetical protein